MTMKCTGPFGTGNRNERGERLLDFAAENNLVVTNSLFFKAANRYWTWEAPEGVTKIQIDFIPSSDRKIEQNCEVITKVDIGSDHQNGQSKSRNRQKDNETKKNLKTKTLPIKPQSIRKSSHSLQNWTKKQIWHSERRRTVYRENEHSPERIYGHHTKPNTKSTIKKSIEDTEIEN